MQPRKRAESLRLMGRPLYVVGLTFGVCLLAAVTAGFHVALIAAALSVLLFIVALAIRRFRRNEAVLAALLSAVAAFSLFSAREYLVTRPLLQWRGQTAELTLWLEEDAGQYEKVAVYIARVRAGALPMDTKVLLTVPHGENAPELYNCVTTSTAIETAPEGWCSDGVYLAAFLEGGTVTVSDERPWDAGVREWRQAVIRQVDKKADGDVAALIRAVCFGDKSQLSEQTKDNFSVAGLSHLMAVSGFHMSTVALGFFGLLCFLGLRRRWAAVLSLPVPLLFAALTGFAYSALRAGVVCLAVMLAAVFRRRADGKNSLGGAVLLILLVDFHAIYDLGFQLSVAATWGILMAVGWSQKKPADRWWRRLFSKVWDAVRVTLAATAATLPIIALTFGWLSMLSPITNLLAQSAASLIVTCGCVGTLFLSVPWLAFLGSPLMLFAGVAARWLLWLTETVAALPFAVFGLDSPYLLLWACAVPAALVFGWRMLRGRGLRLTAMLLVIALCAAMLSHHVGMRGVTVITATELNNGAAVLLTRDGHQALVLAGEGSSREVNGFLHRQGVGRLTFVLYTETESAAVMEDVTVEQTVLPGDEVAVTFWGDSTARLRADGWLFLQLGETQVLLCPAMGDAAALSADERQADLLIFDHTPPQNVTALSAGQAVLCCGAEGMRTVTRAVPWGAYPIEVTADEWVVVKTRGQGDCHV